MQKLRHYLTEMIPHPRREQNLRPMMLNSAIVQIVDFCVQRRWQVVAFGILLAVVSATYDVRRFSITTDNASVISQRLSRLCIFVCNAVGKLWLSESCLPWCLRRMMSGVFQSPRIPTV